MSQNHGTHWERTIKLRHLLCFIEVARHKSAGKAAASLGLSQPAVSKTIHELESSLSAGLFEPNRRSMVLTSLGEIFLRYATSSVTALKQGVRVVAHDSGSRHVNFAIGALPTVSANILPEALANITSQFPDLRLRVVTGSNDVLITQLRLGDIDLVVGRMASPEAMKGLAFEHLYSERIALVVRPDHPLLAAPRLYLTEISRYQLLIPPPGSVIHPVVERYFLAHSIQLDGTLIETVSDAFARNYLLKTTAIWIISEGVVTQDVKAGILATLPVDTDETLGPVGLTTRTDTELPYPAQIIMSSLRGKTEFN